MTNRSTMPSLAALAFMVLAFPALAAGHDKAFDADLAVQSARIETLRARAATAPSTTTATTLIEAESLLRQLREAPADKRSALRAQLDTALTRLELEIDAAGR